MKIQNSRASGQPIQYSLNHPLQNQPLAYGHINPGNVVEHVCNIPDDVLTINLQTGLDSAGCGYTISDTEILEIKEYLSEIWNKTRSSDLRKCIESIEDILDGIH